MARKLTAAEESECAIYAEGTSFTPERLKAAYRTYLGECEEIDLEPLDVQTFCGSALKEASEWNREVVIIDHDRFGDRQQFDSMDEAQAALRECGDEFADVTLSRRGTSVIDERGDVVGLVRVTQ